jgi:hypothetical protein
MWMFERVLLRLGRKAVGGTQAIQVSIPLKDEASIGYAKPANKDPGAPDPGEDDFEGVEGSV